MFGDLILFLLWQYPALVVFLIMVILFVIIMVILLLCKKVVTVPSISATLSGTQFDHGASVTVTGKVDSDVGPPEVPAVGDPLNVDFADSAGTKFPAVGSGVVGSDGTYSIWFAIPAGAAPGQGIVIVTDTKLNISAQQTLTPTRECLQALIDKFLAQYQQCLEASIPNMLIDNAYLN